LASEDFAGYALESFLTTGHPTDYETELKIVMVGRDFIVSTASSAADKVDSNFPDQTDWDINLLTQAGSLAGVCLYLFMSLVSVSPFSRSLSLPKPCIVIHHDMIYVCVSADRYNGC